MLLPSGTAWISRCEYPSLVEAFEPFAGDDEQHEVPHPHPLDLAILGKGFFSIQTAAGEMFSRNGNFKIDKNED